MENNIISDNELRDLLKQKFLEDGENNVLTQKLIEMEAKLVFASTPLILPALHKEKEMITKLGNGLGKKISSVWLFGGIGLVVVTTLTVLKLTTKPVENAQINNKIESTLNSGKEPEQNTNTLISKPENENQNKSIHKIVFSGNIKTENIMPADTPRTIIESQNSQKLNTSSSNIANDTATPVTPATSAISPIKTTNPIAPVKPVGYNPPLNPTIVVPPVVSLLKKYSTTKAKSVVSYKCRILDVQNLCDIPDTLKGPYSGSFTGEHTTFGCTTMDKKGFKLVMLNIEINAETKLALETGFKNVVLAFKDGERYQRPVAMEGNGLGIAREKTFIQNNIIVQKMASKYKDRIDLLFVFAHAEPGDKIIFNNLIEAVIEK